ncbi:MAG: AMP-binding protein, partial [Pseudonocardia sp.]|nr:AMP-binding protein [Pseudonocardia sp.]
LGTVATGELLSGEARFMHAAPMFHLADLAAWAGQVLLGGPHIMIPAFEPKAMLEAIEKHCPTAVLVVPTMLQLLVDHPAVAEHDLSSMQRILYGGSPIGEGLATRTLKLFPGVRMTQAYGMTEVSPVATLLLPDDHKGATIRSGGRAAPHSEIQVIDAEGLPVPAGAVGEVCVRGGHVMLGYWNKPEETADVLVDGWYRTGDLGYLDEEGFLFLVDRLKDMIVTGGENVYSAEVESALSKHPAVAQSAVIGIPNDRWGETVHAVIVLKDGAGATVEELQGFCREHIAGYKAPRSIEFAAELPISGAGKILKRELRKALVESPA